MNPAAAVYDYPAFWSPDIAASVIIADTSCDLLTKLPGPTTRSLIAEHNDEAGRYVILQGIRARHRLRLFLRSKPSAPFEFRVPVDSLVRARLAALSAFSLGACPKDSCGLTAHRRHRLVCLLAILDLTEAPELDGSVLRRIAGLLLSGKMAQARAIEWKGSSDRRQAQRLLAEARRMTVNGYRQLLAGCNA